MELLSMQVLVPALSMLALFAVLMAVGLAADGWGRRAAARSVRPRAE